MKIIESCARCLFDKQKKRSSDPEFLSEIRSLLDNRDENDTAPYLVYLFNEAYKKRFGELKDYKAVKRQYNDLVLSMESGLREKIEAAEDPLSRALLYARIGNYIDFGAMNDVNEETFMALFDEAQLSERDRTVVRSFRRQCRQGKRFLLIADNCGEIVLDRLFLEQLRKEFPNLETVVLVRGSDVLNDATAEDAMYAGIDREAKILSNGNGAAGTIYEMLSEEAKKALDGSDLILSKGQGNYESLCGQGRHIFYSFLCKCDLFTGRFGVPKLTGIFTEENENDQNARE